MTAKDVMLSAPGRHIGYMPQEIYEHSTAPLCWDLSPKLKTIPHKLTAYFNRKLISEARKAQYTDAAGLYFLKLTDNSFLEIVF